MSVTDGIGQTPCSLEHYLVFVYFSLWTVSNNRILLVRLPWLKLLAVAHMAKCIR